MRALKDKTIVVGVCGGIAAYKSAELIRLLVTAGARVRVMMTRSAIEFITPLTLQTLSLNPVATETFSVTQEPEIGHIQLADSADAMVIAPATANLIAKAAAGIADDMVTTVLLAARCPVVFAPAMNVNMYAHPTVVENLHKLRARGVTIIEPGAGALACGYEGRGRLTEPVVIVEELARVLTPHDLTVERILVTAGPTQEAIDPVRFVSNRSTGKMGFAIAQRSLAAGRAGAAGGGTVRAADAARRRAHRYHQRGRAAQCDLAQLPLELRADHGRRGRGLSSEVGGAAETQEKSAGMTLELAPIIDELPRLAAKKAERILIGFAAETEDLQVNALDKLRRKRLDLIVGNDVSRSDAGFAVDTNIVTMLGANGQFETTPKLLKDEVADVILDRLKALRVAKTEIKKAEIKHSAGASRRK